MSILHFQNINLHLGHNDIFDDCNLIIEQGEHLGLLGRNGEGKSTLLKLIAGKIEPDSGKLQFNKNINIQTLPQEVPTNITGKVIDAVANGFGALGQLIINYQRLAKNTDLTESETQELITLQAQLEEQDGWHLYSQIQTIISKLQLEPSADISRLSGGMKRRVLLAQALLTEPDLLLLDEPTNHLDLESIVWLEKFLTSYNGAFILVTHDRSFLQATTNGILELDRGKLQRFNGSYSYYLREKESQLASEEKSNSEFDKKLAQEEKWIRQGIKARRTRNEGRVRALKALRQERLKRRELKGKMSLDQTNLEQSSKVIFEVSNISYQINDQQIIKDFSCLITRQDKIGIIGPNGCGKTTLLKLILGELTPSHGHIHYGAQFKVAYFDQMKSDINEELSAIDNVSQGSTMIEAFGKSQHVISYMKQFLFNPERARSPVKFLSGGERSRLLLARLFTKNANVLVMDEPTNDLDIESLEMLETFLVEYPGTLLLVSHDRTFIENVVTATWVYQGAGHFEEFIGGYQDYLLQSSRKATSDNKAETKAQTNTTKPAPAKVKPKKLSYNEQRELAALPEQIEAIETEIELLQQKLANPETYQATHSDNLVTEINQALKKLEADYEAKLERWELLESK